RKSSDWNIIDFLEECDWEPYRRKIEEYLLSLETIVKMERDQRGENAQRLIDKYKQATEPQRKCWDTGDLRACLMFKSLRAYWHFQTQMTFELGSRPDSKKAKNWEKEHSRKQVHIHRPKITTDISGNMGNITAETIGGGTLVWNPKEVMKGIDEHFLGTLSPCEPPHTPPHRIFPCGSSSGASIPSQQEFSNLDSICSNFDREEVFSQIIGQMQNYEVIENTYLQLSQENSQIVLEEIRKIIEKMKGIEYRLFDYRIINLSERNVTNPVNKLSKSEKRILKDIWNSNHHKKERQFA
ncbi:1182_t:CDS:2, partial [Acaulospora morrowiae]